jgi:hypothetical protein
MASKYGQPVSFSTGPLERSIEGTSSYRFPGLSAGIRVSPQIVFGPELPAPAQIAYWLDPP